MERSEIEEGRDYCPRCKVEVYSLLVHVMQFGENDSNG